MILPSQQDGKSKECQHPKQGLFRSLQLEQGEQVEQGDLCCQSYQRKFLRILVLSRILKQIWNPNNNETSTKVTSTENYNLYILVGCDFSSCWSGRPLGRDGGVQGGQGDDAGHWKADSSEGIVKYLSCFHGIKIEMPLKDNMIDEERAKKEAAGQMTFEQKVNLLNDQVNVLERSTTNY